MKLQFKHQKFQADAAKAVVDVFAGQPYLTPTYMMDRGYGQQTIADDTDFTGWRNERIVPELSDKLILEHLQKVQRTNQIKPSDKLEGRYNLTIEMETGVGKTYTYIKTMYELNKRYGWSKYIIVVPSVAIREGVYKSLQTTQEHFAEEYGRKIRFFIYSSDNDAVYVNASYLAVHTSVRQGARKIKLPHGKLFRQLWPERSSDFVNSIQFYSKSPQTLIFQMKEQ